MCWSMTHEEPSAGGAPQTDTAARSGLPSEQRDGDVSSVGTVPTSDVKLAVLPYQDAPGPEKDGPVAVGNHQLSCRTQR